MPLKFRYISVLDVIQIKSEIDIKKIFLLPELRQ